MISVIMSTYNEPIEFIRQSVQSILKQTFKDIEFIIVIDNPNRKDITNYFKEEKKHDARIRIIKNKENIGLAASLNKAIDCASGKYIARMDADDISEIDRLEKQRRFLLANNLDLVGCNIRNIDEKSCNISNSNSLYPTSNDVIRRYLRFDSAIPHPTWFARAEVLKNNKYNNLRASQDYELLTRLATKGYKLGNVKEILLNYRINSDSISATKKVLQKTVKYYASINYKKKRMGSIEDYNKYLNNPLGQKRIEQLEKYQIGINALKKDNSPKIILQSKYILFSFKSRIARENIINELKKIYLRIRYAKSF